MSLDRSALEKILGVLRQPGISSAIADARNATEKAAEERDDYHNKLKDLVAEILTGFVDDPRVGEVVRLFGEPLVLLSTEEGTGGRWEDLQIGTDGKLYSVHHKQGSTGSPEVVTVTNAGNLYAGYAYSLTSQKEPLAQIRPMLERQVADNFAGYVAMVERAITSLRQTTRPT